MEESVCRLCTNKIFPPRGWTTHGRVKIRGNVNRWSVIKLSKRSLHAPRAVYTRATRAAVIHSDVSLVRKGVNLAEPMAESRAQILPLVPFARKT